MQERRNSIALAMELHLSYTNQSISSPLYMAIVGSDNGLSSVRREAII